MAKRGIRGAILVHRSPKYDPQRDLVYKWERKFSNLYDHHRMSPRAAQELVTKVSKYYGIDRPKLEEKRRGHNRIMAWGAPTKITFNSDVAYITAPVLAHELAHSVVQQLECYKHHHGPTWLGVYLHIMGKFKIMPAPELALSARRYGLNVRDPSKCGPRDL